MKTTLENLHFIIEELETFKRIIKNSKPRLQVKDIKKQVLKKYRSKDLNRERILKIARKTAHSKLANVKRTMSVSLKNRTTQ